MPDIQNQIKELGAEIAAEFLKRVTEVKLAPDEIALMERAAQRLAYVAIHLPGANDTDKGLLTLQRDAALATLGNLSVTKAIQAEQIMRQAAFDAVAKALKMGLGLAVTVLAA